MEKNLEKILNAGKIFLAGTLIFAGLPLLYGCGDSGGSGSGVQFGPKRETKTGLVFSGERNLGAFHRPGGLKSGGASSVPSLREKGLTTNLDGTISYYFLSDPSVDSQGGFVQGGEPKVYEIRGTPSEINAGTASTTTAYTFSSADAGEFYTGQRIGSTLAGLYLRVQPFNLASIVSKSPSDRLSEILNGVKRDFARDDEIIGTVDMHLGSNGRIYLPQSMIINCADLPQNQWTVSRQRRVISINPNDLSNLDGSLKYKTEFVLPDGTMPIKLTGILTGERYFNQCLPTDDMIRVVENSPAGKTSNGNEFYISDFLTGMVYSTNAGGVASAFRNIPYPTALAVEENGKVLVTKGPIFRDVGFGPRILDNSQLIELDPANSANDAALYTLAESPENFTGYLVPDLHAVPPNNDSVPTTYTLSMAVTETATTATAVISNTATNAVSALQFNKVTTTQ
ncbi:hypothetical protein HY449_02090 [Candidatus Pacearchaeota archaeon]|nr:hypothetical protein [Candidatus Pacearchaeota archaeon]